MKTIFAILVMAGSTLALGFSLKAYLDLRKTEIGRALWKDARFKNTLLYIGWFCLLLGGLGMLIQLPRAEDLVTAGLIIFIGQTILYGLLQIFTTLQLWRPKKSSLEKLIGKEEEEEEEEEEDHWMDWALTRDIVVKKLVVMFIFTGLLTCLIVWARSL